MLNLAKIDEKKEVFFFKFMNVLIFDFDHRMESKLTRRRKEVIIQQRVTNRRRAN